MKRLQSNWVRRTFGKNYKWVSTLTTILIIGLVLYFLLPQIFPAALRSEGQPSPYVSARGVLLQDDFTNPNSGWPSENQANASFGYQSPSFYYLEVSAPNNRLAVSPGLNLINFSAETKATVDYTDTSNGDFRYGLVVRRSGENYYAFTISPRSGTWQVLKYAPGSVKVLAEDKQAWLRNTFRLFTLSVSASGKTLSFQINNQPVIQLTDPDYTSGEVGFIVETIDETLVHVSFDSIKVQKIQDQPALVAATSTSPALTTPPAAATASKPATPTASPVSTATLIVPTSTPDSSLNDTLPPLTPTVSGLAPTTELMPPLQTPSPLPLSTPLPSATPQLPTSTPSPTPTTIPATLTPTLNPTPTSGSVPATSPAPAPSTPTSTPTTSATPTPGVPTGEFVLLAPLDLERPSFGPTNFEWEWTGAVPAGFGFEVRVWQEGEAVAGAHNAVLDNQDGNIKSMGENKYTLNIDIKDAAGVRGRKGEYLWTVALVQISPSYADLGQQAQPARLRFETPGGSGGGGGGGNGGGGGGVGVQ